MIKLNGSLQKPVSVKVDKWKQTDQISTHYGSSFFYKIICISVQLKLLYLGKLPLMDCDFFLQNVTRHINFN